MARAISLDFDDGALRLTAELFETRTADGILAVLPREMELTAWGDEVYGRLGANLPDESPQGNIEPGGLAYTNQGDYLCVFFGQQPAWPVEYVGRISGDEWRKLRGTSPRRLRVAALEKEA